MKQIKKKQWGKKPDSSIDYELEHQVVKKV